ncbi:MAG: hypothetical protein HY717_13765 [Planctomycetes bacterium]|nr:hypothetical protein [Planctomycetota bacterium]
MNGAGEGSRNERLKPPEATAERRLEALMDSIAERLRCGERPAIEEYMNRNPDLAERIREVFPALLFVEKAQEPKLAGTEASGADGAAGPPAGEPVPRKLGDYRLIRELGRGGMGREASNGAALSARRSRRRPKAGGSEGRP